MKKSQKEIKTILSGGHAVAEAMKQLDPDVMAVYPITPQTPVVEYFAKKGPMVKLKQKLFQLNRNIAL